MVEQADKYDPWARLYNQTLGPKYARQKMIVLGRVLFPFMPHNGRVLDLCCGTGHLAAALLEQGYEVIGLDGSSDMLRFARSNAAGATFVQGDARAFGIATNFDAVVCASASLNHMESLEDLGKVFSHVHAALRPGGTFVFDINHPAQMVRFWRGQPAEGIIRTDHAFLITPRYDAQTARGTFTLDIYRRPDGVGDGLPQRLLGALLRSRRLVWLRLRILAQFARFQPGWEHQSIDYPVWGHPVDAVVSLLRERGFATAVENYDGSPLTEENSAFFICRKRAAPSAIPGASPAPADAGVSQ